MRILHVASENGALPGGKVGGIGDVIRELPRAQAAQGDEVTVVTPAYGMFGQLPGATAAGRVDTHFGGSTHDVGIVRIPDNAHDVTHLVLEHPFFSPHGSGHIYHDDGPLRPFATDAQRFAFFSAAVSAMLAADTHRPEVVHLHDWHAAFVLVLRAYSPALTALRDIPCVYTIHNLAYQGVRPYGYDESSFEAWFYGLDAERSVLRDPHHGNCVNPMAAAIRLADRVGTVSPTYAREILRPSDPAHGFYGGEGLEQDLRAAADEGRLIGILNGCDYDDVPARRPPWARVIAAVGATGDLPATRPAAVLTAISRLTAQKSALFLEPAAGYPTALEAILDRAGNDTLFIMLGSGDAKLEARFATLAAAQPRFVLLNGFSEALSQTLYAAGDLFLMPSSFEPCGISQMQAMRAGQPCVVHAVGGLRDTVDDGVTGFTFDGDTAAEQAGRFVRKTLDALALRNEHASRWGQIRRQARAIRFSWDNAATDYRTRLYAHAGP